VLREFSAGGVVYKKERRGKTSWLVAKSAPSELFPKGFWRLPKGWLDDTGGGDKPGPLAKGMQRATQEELRQAAIREVVEEGGVEAKIVDKIGTERYFFTVSGRRILKFVTFYLMEWVKDLPEGPAFETEKVVWLLYKEARARLTHSGEKKTLDKAKRLLDSGIQESLI
jgi:8-oxo-dGTP pyrophosphatase MutT (NUDIX family)